MINLTRNQIDITLTKIEDGLNQYCWIQKNLINTNVSLDRIFQRKFIYFYKIRRNQEWLKYYFSLLEYAKNNKIYFENALEYIFEKTRRYEASFISKLIATIEPELPVIDKFVLRNVGLRLPNALAENRMARIIEIYEELKNIFIEFLNTEKGDYLVKKFDESFRWANVTNTKMIDFVLWQTR